MPTAYVTGAAGAIGRHCVAELRARGWAVGGIGHGPVQWSSDGVEDIDCWIAGDAVGDGLDLLAERLGLPELVINLAGGSSVGPSLRAPLGDFERTVATGVGLLNWVWRHAPEARLSFASSAAVYGNGYDRPIREDDDVMPLSPYGHHKLMLEDHVRFWARTFGIRSSVVRLFSVYGPGLHKQLVHELCGRLAKAPESLILAGGGGETRDWLWIGDAARMMIDLGQLATAAAPTFNGGTGRPTTIRSLAEQLAALWPYETRVVFDQSHRSGDPHHLQADVERLVSAGVQARMSLEEGLERTVVAWRANFGK